MNTSRSPGVLLIVALLLLAAAMLAVRALALSRGVVLAGDDLAAGRTVRAGDLRGGWWRPGGDYFSTKEQVAGLVLRSDVPRRRAIRHEDVLRPQVVAAFAIPPDTIIGPESVQLSWTPFIENAAESVESVLGKRLARGVRQGDVILNDLLRPAPEPAPPSAARFSFAVAAGGLPAGVGVGDRVTLLFVPNAEAAALLSPTPAPGVPITVPDAVIRAVQRGESGATITVAVGAADEARVARLAGVAQVIIYVPSR